MKMKKSGMLLALVVAFLAVGAAEASGNPPYHRGNLIHTSHPFVRVGGDQVIFGFKVAGCDVESLKVAAISLKNRATTDRYGWAAVQNQPNTWSARSAKHGWENMPNGTQKKYSFTINGQKVDLDIFNPMNEGALTGNDILISFGY
jgi:hypothetical protein